jgi:hypothetical protein
MPCIACGSNCEKEFATEMILHLSGIKNLDEPGVWAFPKLFVCMNCGYSHFIIEEPSWRPLQTSILRANSGSGHVS